MACSRLYLVGHSGLTTIPQIRVEGIYFIYASTKPYAFLYKYEVLSVLLEDKTKFILENGTYC